MAQEEQNWQALFEAATIALKTWRAAHPEATFNDIEDNVDGELARLRAQLLQDLAQANPATDWRRRPKEKRPVCPDCGLPLQANGKQVRQLITDREQVVELRRQQGRCPGCGGSVFPPG